MNVFVPGTYNQWLPNDPSVKAEQEAKGRYAFHRVLTAGVHRFKFVVEGDWAHSWGAKAQTRLVGPCAGDAEPDGTDIVVNAPGGGSYTFTLDLEKKRWKVETAPHSGGGLDGLNGTTVSGRRAHLLKALSASNGHGLDDSMVGGVESLLQEGSRNGNLPLRVDGRILLAYLAHPGEKLQVAASWQGWGDHLIPLHAMPGHHVHVAAVPIPAGVHQYKVIYDGRWTRDPYNPWVTPDRIPVPKFQLGDFNSIVAMEASPLTSGGNLLSFPGFQSVRMGNRRDVFVWLPRTYADDKVRRYRTLYVLDGNEALTRNFFHETLRDLVAAGEAEEAILVFVAFANNNERLYELADPEGRVRYAQFFQDELVPFIDGAFRTEARASERGMAGVSLGGNFAFYLAWCHPDVFGWAAAQGAAWAWNQWDVIRQYQSEPARPIRLYLDSSYPARDGDPEDSSAASRHAAEVLTELGYPVVHFEMPCQEHDWPSWRLRQPHLLSWFAPLISRLPRRRASATPS